MAGREAEKRNTFAAAYLGTMDLKAAAKAAGYAPKPELLEKCRGEVEHYRALLGQQVTYEDVIRRLTRLGFGSGGECAALLEGRWEEDGLDLSLVSEVKKGGNGAIEVKLIDRVSVLRLLLELLKVEEDGAEAFLRSLQDGEAVP